jgi:hypothetical protein
VVQLLQWSLCFDVASVEPHLVAHIERREGKLHTSHLLFILGSHDHELVTYISVDITKVECSLVSLCGGDCLNVYLDIEVKSCIRKEQYRGRIGSSDDCQIKFLFSQCVLEWRLYFCYYQWVSSL